ncbi:deoxyribonuclease-1-like [Asterias amurensis]|uniref:deoxyribonuclease-1-like n=1 Tax=Asterias amurensis TaxID=7602 RepID=UPI003AB88A7F
MSVLKLHLYKKRSHCYVQSMYDTPKRERRKHLADTMNFYAVIVTLFLVGVFVEHADGVRLGTFNIQSLGDNKMARPHVVDVLQRILSRYDLVMIQELRTPKVDAINALLLAVNTYSAQTYKMVVGPRVGRSTSKEQYVFFYRADKFEVMDQYSYVEANDEFEREPYIVRFHSLTSSSLPNDFAVANIHTKPGYRYTRHEVNALVTVYDDIMTTWPGLEDVIITGDYNADCKYIKKSYWPTIQLRTQKRFYWATPDDADTTVSSTTDCAYDRFVLAGSKMTASLPSSVVFYYDKEYNLDEASAKEVSDHYPVELTF